MHSFSIFFNYYYFCSFYSLFCDHNSLPPPPHTLGSNCPEFCVNHSLTFIFNFIIHGYIINNNLVLFVFELQIKKIIPQGLLCTQTAWFLITVSFGSVMRS